MILDELKQQVPSSPAFLLDEDQVIDNLKPLQELREQTGCKILYSMKALPLTSLLSLLKDKVDGISVSSLFEARLAKEVLGDAGSIHLTTPGIRVDEFCELTSLCSHISFNSLPQLQRLGNLTNNYSKGLRVNPKRSYLSDQRYDPCRSHSKLGIDIQLLEAGIPDGIEGLHVHNTFACRNFDPLVQSVGSLIALLSRHSHIKWVNLGGGYLFNTIVDYAPLIKLINRLKAGFSVEVFLEPGKAVVGNAGYLLTTVIDRFVSDGKVLLVLDTSVNHNPEVFEYQIKPTLLEEEHEASQVAILAGSTCLAGDLFGEYRFKRIPEVDDRLLFADLGAYSLIKANRFNGYNLPDIYRISTGCVIQSKCYGYEDYRSDWSSN